MRHLLVARPGMLTTVQDLGRWGFQHAGVPVAGPMDFYSHHLANRMVGNPPGAAALEVTLIGPEIESDAPVLCAVAGADFEVTVAGRVVDCSRAFTVARGQRLRFGPRRSGARATLAVAGGIAVAPVFGSRSTSLSSALGGIGGRALKADDMLPVGEADGVPGDQRGTAFPLPAGGATLRTIEGPHAAMFRRSAFDLLYGSRFTVTPASNRMGYRLSGPALEHEGGADILSDATPIGSLQVPASGQPILLMADRQTTGGYPKIATVITADLPLAGQLAPGDWIEFTPCTRAEAIDALRSRYRALGVAM